MLKSITLSIAASTLLFSSAFAQTGLVAKQSEISSILNGQTPNAISTAVPFLTISPDARAAGMGDNGVATSPDANSGAWNTAKLAFVDQQSAISINYTPWLKGLVNDIYLAYLSGYYKLDKRQAITGSLRYFSLGSITFTDANANTLGTYNPNEFAIDAGYALKLSPNFSGGFAMRYIYSNLTQGQSAGSTPTNAGQAVAADLSGFYFNDVEIKKQKIHFTAGFNISNMGSKISYSQTGQADFLPTNLRLGGGARMNIDEYNTLGIYLDLNKLLVPTPPLYDTSRNVPKGTILAGENPNRGIVSGMLGSFTDAPGGFREEFQEIDWSPGVEYWYDNQFALRAGYFYENASKGDRQYYTVGLGLRYNVFGLDISYLIPATTLAQNPLANTLRFSLIFNFEDNKEKHKEGASN